LAALLVLQLHTQQGALEERAIGESAQHDSERSVSGAAVPADSAELKSPARRCFLPAAAVALRCWVAPTAADIIHCHWPQAYP